MTKWVKLNHEKECFFILSKLNKLFILWLFCFALRLPFLGFFATQNFLNNFLMIKWHRFCQIGKISDVWYDDLYWVLRSINFSHQNFTVKIVTLFKPIRKPSFLLWILSTFLNDECNFLHFVQSFLQFLFCYHHQHEEKRWSEKESWVDLDFTSLSPFPLL